MKLNLKQTKALDYLEDGITTEVEYGGAANQPLIGNGKGQDKLAEEKAFQGVTGN